MPRRRILFYTHALAGGGAERVWALLARGFHEAGHAVTVAVDFEDDANRHLIPPDVPVHVLGRRHWRAVLGLADVLRSSEAEAALSAVGASNAKLLAAAALVRRPLATILSAHGFLAAEYGKLGRATYRATPVTSRLASRTVAVSDGLRRALIDRHGADPERTITIPNPVLLPPQALVPTADALAARPATLLAMGRLVPEKGFDVLLQALARCPPATRLIVLGTGPQAADLATLADSLGLTDRVEWRGYRTDPSPVFAEARALVAPSRTEAFGNVIVEALAHGLPVVATRSGGPQEILGEGAFGRLVNVGDVEGLAAAITGVLASPGDPAPRRARAEHYALPRIVGRYEQVIETALSKRRPA